MTQRRRLKSISILRTRDDYVGVKREEIVLDDHVFAVEIRVDDDTAFDVWASDRPGRLLVASTEIDGELLGIAARSIGSIRHIELAAEVF